ALKVLHADLAESPDSLQRFQREMRAGGKLNHPHIVPTLDADQVGDTMFLVMEYVPGTNLALLVWQNGPLPIEQALRYVAHAAEGLAHAHDQGVIHRDIKPSNLLCDERGNVRVLDLGLARFAADGLAQQTQLTGTGELLGTVDYMAPEQAQSTRKADARSDIYSLGCTLAYLLTGQPPFSGESVLKRLMAHRDTPIPSLCDMRHDVPDVVNRIFQKMVAKQPADRYQSMRELLADLAPLVGSHRPRSRWVKRGVLAVVAASVLIAGVMFARQRGVEESKKSDEPNKIVQPVAPPSVAIAPFDGSQAVTHQEAWAKYLNQPVETTNGIGMKLRLIPPGEFQQGANEQEVEVFSNLEGRSLATDGPRHRVRLTQPFYIGVSEVTQAEYQTVIGSNPSMFSPTGEFAARVADSETTQHPVENVTWFDAIEFCNALSLREKLTPCYERLNDEVTIVTGTGYRLPTEAEWEFGCRAGTESPWSFGEQDAAFEQFAWVAMNGEFRSHPVGQLLPNAFKLHDLHGNLWEWCQDVFDPSYYESFTDSIT
ncbi:MAG: SUMF1/EgtB/PvdO family nonheme iron enzyme, partial [Planctomycetaceae bacterium]|nr:SUMF1/EgtB/PvdO family nonheme iron enzyme [Planctomycetaceae bacterium]